MTLTMLGLAAVVVAVLLLVALTDEVAMRVGFFRTLSTKSQNYLMKLNKFN